MTPALFIATWRDAMLGLQRGFPAVGPEAV